MAELTEQQQHLSSLLEQRAGLVAEINDLNSQAAAKRELVLRSLGAIEYLQQIGVTLPEPEAEAAAEGEVPEGEAPTPETEELPEPTPEGQGIVVDSSYTEKDYWEGRVPDELFEEYLNRYGYEYTPINQGLDKE